MTGNYYDESSLCHALANFVPRKIQTDFKPLTPNLLESRKCRNHVIRNVEVNNDLGDE
jgi:hypothetical protein